MHLQSLKPLVQLEVKAHDTILLQTNLVNKTSFPLVSSKAWLGPEYISNCNSHQILDIYLLISRSQPHFYCRNLHSLCRLSPRLIKQPSLDDIAPCSVHPQQHCWNMVLVSILQHDVQIPHMAGRCCDLSLPGCPSLSPDPTSYTLSFLETRPVKLHRVPSRSCGLDVQLFSSLKYVFKIQNLSH